MPGTFTYQFNSPVYSGTVSVQTNLFIGGKFVEPIDGETIDVINPANGQVITKVAAGNAKDIDVAVKVARETFKKSWGLKVPGSERGKLLYKLADLFEKHADELAALEALDVGKFPDHPIVVLIGGKPYLQARANDISLSAQAARYYAGWADKNHGQTIETNEAKFAYTRHEPIGVCALVVPWNYPLMIAVLKVAPALAAGNAIILKPSEVTPLTALKLAELVNEAGFPPGSVNIIVGYGSTAGQALSEHAQVDMISFTGSTLVGRKIMEAAGRSNLKRVALELGGKSPTIIFDDADLEQAVKWAIGGIFQNGGQMCIAGSRIFVHEGIYDEFLKTFAAFAQKIKQGDGFDPDVADGPVVSETQFKRVLGYIESGKTEGATVLTGGARLGDKGYFVQPTIFTDVKPEMKIIREEIFGPVCAVIKFKTEQEVIDLANDTVYGLSSAVWSRNISRAVRVAHALEAGQAYINSGGMPAIQVPFGGYKQSGFGKELGSHGLEEFTNVKAVHVNLGMQL